MKTGPVLKTGAIAAVSAIAFETWFRVTSLREIEKRQQEIEQAKHAPFPAGGHQDAWTSVSTAKIDETFKNPQSQAKISVQ